MARERSWGRRQPPCSAPLSPPFRHLAVRALSATSTRGLLLAAGRAVACSLGRSGRRTLKREGDGATPAGRWRIERVLYRADRVPRPRTALAVQAIRHDDGWCDAPADRNYNRPVRLPYPASAERLWRDDGLYDVVVVLAHNRRPRRRGGGSAVFIHVARPAGTPTEGCIALERETLCRLLARIPQGCCLVVPPAASRYPPASTMYDDR